MRPLSEPVRIRPATPQDVPVLLSLIRDLAEYERAPEQAVGTEELLHEALFGSDAVAEALIAEVGDEPAGLAIFYRTFSTWQCLPGLWLEDLFVAPAHRRGGIGRALLCHLAALAVSRGYGRLGWTVLDWNRPAIDFYESLGAERMNEWREFRLSGTSLRAVADDARA